MKKCSFKLQGVFRENRVSNILDPVIFGKVVSSFCEHLNVFYGEEFKRLIVDCNITLIEDGDEDEL